MDSMNVNPPSQGDSEPQNEHGNDLGDPHPGPSFEKHATAGQSHGEGTTILEDIALHDFVKERKSNIHYPFKSQDD